VNENEIGLNRYLREIGRIPLLTPKQEIELAGRIKKGDAVARERMINANLRLVVTIAHDYANLGLPLLDLISEGNIGLTKAVERFDPAKKAKLSTYAAWWIKQAIKRALANQSKTIRIPVHLGDKIAKVRRVSLQMSDELGREPTDDELAEELGIATEKLAQLKASGFGQLRSTPPLGMKIPLNLERALETKRRGLRLNYCATKICSVKSDRCSLCSTSASTKSFRRGLVLTEEGRRLWRTSAKISASRASGFVNCRIVR
jgi:RNA polymerase sigma factor (sigma-70 family)